MDIFWNYTLAFSALFYFLSIISTFVTNSHVPDLPMFDVDFVSDSVFKRI